jgi:outer membrane protein OmpA-like peptidoglycan-associated protein
MMRANPRFAVMLLLAGLAGCGLPDNVFVLQAGADGSSGAIEISNSGGTVTVDKPSQATGVDSPRAAPGAPKPVDDAAVREAFGAALSAEPRVPVRFILYFKTNTADLRPESEPELPKVLEAVRRMPAADISVSGHADKTGSAATNYALSLQRAEKMRDTLIAAGVDPQRIDASSHGANNPLIETPEGVAEPRNRRVEIVVR